jgi:ASC-1-like (ASCH) protein
MKVACGIKVNMHTHEMKLRTEPFLKIKNGSKKVESRLYDEKRQAIKIGDTLTFIHQNDDGTLGETIDTRVVGLLLYPSFESMMNDIPALWFGWEESILAINEINQFYPTEEQEKSGVVGIRIERLLVG